MIKSFELKVYRGNTVTHAPDYSATGVGDEWVNHIRLRFSGFDGSVFLSLEDFWRSIIKNKIESCTQQLEGYETVVKHGDTMQLKEPFMVELKTKF